MRIIFCFLFVFLQTFLFSDVSIEVSKDKEVLFINQTLTVSYTVSFSEDEKPDFDALLLALKQAPPYSFQIQSSKLSPHLLSFELRPTHLGTCVFAPGFLSFGKGKKMLLPAVSILCVMLPGPALTFAPLLSLYPESKITLTEQNRRQLQSKKVVEHEEAKIIKRWLRRKDAWNTIIFTFLLIVCAAIFAWLVIEYRILHTLAKAILPQQDPASKVIALLQDKMLPLTERWGLVSRLIRIKMTQKEALDCMHKSAPELVRVILHSTKMSPEEKEKLSAITRRIDAICFGREQSTEEEWQAAKFLLTK